MDDSSAVAGVVRASALKPEALPGFLGGRPAVRAVPAGDGDRQGLNPLCNTGVYLTEGVELSVHWLRQVGDVEELLHQVEELLPAVKGHWEPCRGIHFRQEGLRLVELGVSVSFDVDPSGRRVRGILEFPGKACEAVGTSAVLAMAKRRPDDCRRMDLAFDGWRRGGGNLEPAALYAMVKGNGSSIRSLIDRSGVTLWENLKGEQTAYFGSRQSERFLRCYNERGPTRMELELRGEYVKNFARCVSYGVNVRQAAVGFLRDFIEFVQPGESNVSRAELQDWWASVVERWDRLRISGKKVVDSLQRVKSWLVRQVSAALCTVVRADGGSVEFLDELLSEGQRRMRARHYQLLAGKECVT